MPALWCMVPAPDCVSAGYNKMRMTLSRSTLCLDNTWSARHGSHASRRQWQKLRYVDKILDIYYLHGNQFKLEWCSRKDCPRPGIEVWEKWCFSDSGLRLLWTFNWMWWMCSESQHQSAWPWPRRGDHQLFNAVADISFFQNFRCHSNIIFLLKTLAQIFPNEQMEIVWILFNK